MRQFLKYVLATIVGLLLFSFVGFLLLIGIGAAISSSDSKVSVANNSVLKVDLNQPFRSVASITHSVISALAAAMAAPSA